MAKKGGRLVVDSSNVCFVARARGGLGYRRVSPRETRRRCADATREGGFKKKRTFRRFRGEKARKKTKKKRRNK